MPRPAACRFPDRTTTESTMKPEHAHPLYRDRPDPIARPQSDAPRAPTCRIALDWTGRGPPVVRMDARSRRLFRTWTDPLSRR